MFDIDSGYASKYSLTSTYPMTDKDRKVPGMGARLRSPTPLSPAQEAAVTKIFEESFHPPVRVSKKDGTIR